MKIVCVCGCGNELPPVKRVRADKQRRYLKGHHRPWLGKKREDMIGNKFRVGLKAWNSGKKWREFTGENHPRWKGESVGYSALHIWVKREFGDPKECVYCGRSKTTRGTVQWANISGDYKRDLSDWITLCAKCHYYYDRYGETPVS